jgi:fluoroquinolone transport system permease protein
MNAVRAIRALGPVDARNLRRDAMLRWMVPAPLLVGLVVRYLVPWIAVLLQQRVGFDLRPYYALISSFLLMLSPMLVGMVFGFLLLDQRDDQTLTALQVTPLSLNGYLTYRISLPVVLAAFQSMVMIPLAGLEPVNGLALVFGALAAAPLAPLMAVFYATAATNKVEGFAVMKISGILFVPPLIAYFVQSNWQWAFGLMPTYWPIKVYWLFQTGSGLAWLALGVGLWYQVGLMAVLLRRFNRVMHSGD